MSPSFHIFFYKLFEAFYFVFMESKNIIVSGNHSCQISLADISTNAIDKADELCFRIIFGNKFFCSLCSFFLASVFLLFLTLNNSIYSSMYSSKGSECMDFGARQRAWL